MIKERSEAKLKQTREIISARKTSHKHNRKALRRLRPACLFVDLTGAMGLVVLTFTGKVVVTKLVFLFKISDSLAVGPFLFCSCEGVE